MNKNLKFAILLFMCFFISLFGFEYLREIIDARWVRFPLAVSSGMISGLFLCTSVINLYNYLMQKTDNKEG